MRHFAFNARTAAFAGVLFMASLGAARAQTVEAALDRFKTLVEGQGAAIEWDGADISGPDATLTGVRITTDGRTTPMGDIVLTGIAETDKGYRVDTIEGADFRQTVEGVTVAVDGISMSGVILPDEEHVDAYGGFLFADTIDLGLIRVSTQDKDVFTLTNLHMETSDAAEGEAMEFTGTAENFAVDLSIVQNPQQRAIIQALGYEQISGFIDMAGSWNSATGQLAVSQYDMTVNDAGTLGVSFSIGGYTTDFVKATRELQQQAADNPDADRSAMEMAMLGLMQQLSFNGMEISFQDDSLTGKILKLVADGQGLRPTDVANQAKAILPFALAQLGNPELSANVTQAVSTFLDNPQSLRIKAAPAAPVPFVLLAAGATAPQELTKMLGITVTANE